MALELLLLVPALPQSKTLATAAATELSSSMEYDAEPPVSLTVRMVLPVTMYAMCTPGGE